MCEGFYAFEVEHLILSRSYHICTIFALKFADDFDLFLEGRCVSKFWIGRVARSQCL